MQEKINKISNKENQIIEIAKEIEKAGGKLYLVGGAIRNHLLNLPITDEDYCVTGLTQKEFEQLFPQAKIQGKDFPVYILNEKAFALARTERKNGIGHKQFEFLTDKSITIEQDLARRDITINSIAQDVLTKEIIDPFHGRKDIQNKIIRKTTDAFAEDPLRVYRVARFAASLNFEVEKDTLNAMTKLKEELKTLSKERVFTEFKKALSTNYPSKFFEILKQANILDVHFKEINNLIGKTQPQKHHPEGDSYTHTMIVLDNSVKLSNHLAIRFSCLVHDLGKGTTPNEILPHHYGHEARGVTLVSQLGNRIGIPKEWIKCGKTACKWHMKAGIFEQMSAKKKIELIENVANSLLGLEGLKIVVACDKSREGKDLQEQLESISFDKIGRNCMKEINGKFIRTKYPTVQGEEFGNRLHEERVRWLKNK